ncbi:MAG: sensor histidine kinase [Candidatus Binatia bacterium]
MIVIVTCYLMLFSKGQLSEDPWIHALVAVFLITGVAIHFLPEALFQRPYFDPALLVIDTTLISAAIYMNRDVSWDLFLFYFFILYLAAIGESMLKIVIGSVIISIVYVGLLLQQGKQLTNLGPDLFLRIPFLFGVSILYGYLLENANREKRRAETAEQREHLKMDLVSALAHDMKTPLGVIIGYADNVMSRLAGRSEETRSVEALQRIQHNAERIVHLVTGFLEASKAEAGKLDVARRALSVNRLIRDVAQQLQGDLERKELALELELDETLPDVLADQTQLDRVFWNLISNAIKFTPSGGKIFIRSRRDGAYFCVSVQDTGIGIAREDLPLLYSQFRRLKGSGKIEGTGLGLFIVKTIVEAHRGAVQVESVEGKGSTFSVRIPIHS